MNVSANQHAIGMSSSSVRVDERKAVNYFTSIPAVPEFNADRHLGPMRLREIKKALDNGQGLKDVESVAYECMSEIVELCSGKARYTSERIANRLILYTDYIGNTIVQKLFEHCCNDTKLAMIERIAPYLASIGIHKNGTWAAQKIIDTASTDQQVISCERICNLAVTILTYTYNRFSSFAQILHPMSHCCYWISLAIMWFNAVCVWDPRATNIFSTRLLINAGRLVKVDLVRELYVLY